VALVQPFSLTPSPRIPSRRPRPGKCGPSGGAGRRAATIACAFSIPGAAPIRCAAVSRERRLLTASGRGDAMVAGNGLQRGPAGQSSPSSRRCRCQCLRGRPHDSRRGRHHHSRCRAVHRRTPVECRCSERRPRCREWRACRRRARHPPDKAATPDAGGPDYRAGVESMQSESWDQAADSSGRSPPIRHGARALQPRPMPHGPEALRGGVRPTATLKSIHPHGAPRAGSRDGRGTARTRSGTA
jgi:hypothetical protein